ncbi:MAG: AI-2E family transporter [Saprospiraceae bacterium]
MNQQLSLQKLAYFMVIVGITIYVLCIGQAFFAPLLFAVLFAFMLIPLCNFFEHYTKSRVLGILCSYSVVVLPIIGAIFMFSYQFFKVFADFSLVTETLVERANETIMWVEEELDITPDSGREWLMENAADVMDAPIDLVGSSLTSSTTVVFNIFLIFLYTFFFLLYRSALQNYFLIQFSEERRAEAMRMMDGIQQVAQKYLFGMMIVIVILGFCNSIGLSIIGIDYAFFWGFLAAFLAIIPYIGTTLGGLLPFLYAIATTGTFWQPAAVIVLFGTVQTIEGNLITPNVVGGTVNVNPLAAIISLILGGMMWGISGLILAIPMIAILRITFHYIDSLKPVSLLLGSDLYSNSEVILSSFDEDRYRLFDVFQAKYKRSPLKKESEIKKEITPTDTAAVDVPADLLNDKE